MAEKKKRIKMVTPAGRFRYPKLDKPDYGSKEYPKEFGEFSVQLILPAKDPATKAFLSKLEPFYQAALENARAEFDKLKIEQRKKLKQVQEQPLFTEIYDPETEKPTGDIVFKFATAASYRDKKEDKIVKRNAPPMFSATNKPLKGVSPWGGTLGKVSFSFEEGGYFIAGTAVGGLKMYLEGTQILELVQGGQRDAKSLGFDAEDGYDDIDSGEADSPFGDDGGDAGDDQDATDF